MKDFFHGSSEGSNSGLRQKIAILRVLIVFKHTKNQLFYKKNMSGYRLNNVIQSSDLESSYITPFQECGWALEAISRETFKNVDILWSLCRIKNPSDSFV